MSRDFGSLMYTISTPQFSGPLSKLLELIEERELEITAFSLGSVTADFLEFTKNIEAIAPGVLADFAIVASKLMLIKSKALLPDLKLTDEEEVEIGDLEKQLQLYREIKKAGELISGLCSNNKARSFSRSLFMGRPSIFYPPKKFTPGDLHSLINTIGDVLLTASPEMGDVKFVTISLEDRIKSLVSRINKDPKSNFSKLANSGERQELVVLFLAVLHLIKEKVISVVQDRPFEDMMIEKISKS